MPSFSHTLPVGADPSAVFGIVDDVGRTPEWLTRCTGIDKLDDGPNRVGTRYHYHYRDGRRTGSMEGAIVARVPDRHFTMQFADAMMDVTVDVAATPDGGGTSLTHTIDIATKGFGRLFAPVIRRTLPEQTLDAMARLKALAEGG
jgi:carbon monoxide dehydrogenase subunit G